MAVRYTCYNREEIVNTIAFLDTEIDRIKETCYQNPAVREKLGGVKRVLDASRSDLYEQLRDMGGYDLNDDIPSLKFENGKVIIL